MILGPIAASLIQMAISRRREYMADAAGASYCKDPMALAYALNNLDAYSRNIPMQANPATENMFIVNPLTGGSVQRLFSTHPPMEERIANLQEMARTGRYPH
jgi:heat shock protein HtpX